MLNGIFVVIILISVLLGALSGQMQAVTDSIFISARDAVDLAIGLIGVMALFLGLFRVAEDGGLLRAVSRAVAPITPDGRIASPAVLIARNRTMALLAVPFRPFSLSSSSMALIPNGVAALASPSMLLEMLRIMALIAG